MSVTIKSPTKGTVRGPSIPEILRIIDESNLKGGGKVLSDKAGKPVKATSNPVRRIRLQLAR